MTGLEILRSALIGRRISYLHGKRLSTTRTIDEVNLAALDEGVTMLLTLRFPDSLGRSRRQVEAFGIELEEIPLDYVHRPYKESI